MKKLLIAILVFLLFACSERYVLHANLRWVHDEKLTLSDEMNNKTYKRVLILHYFSTNTSNDSIFIPIGDPYENSITVNVMSRDSLKASNFWETCKIINNAYGKHLFAPGDIFEIKIWFNLSSGNSNYSEWLQKVSTKELMSKLEIKMNKPTEGKDIDRIPDIIFHNDTVDILINPIIRVRKDTIKGEARDACRH